MILMGVSKTRYQLGFFVLNTLHFIVNDGSYWCYCQGKQKYKTCILPIIFSDFEKYVEKNIFNYSFLSWYYTKLCEELIQLFDRKKLCIECFQGEFEFRGRDWHTREYWSVTFFESIRCNEKIQVDSIKHEKLPLPPKYREDTIDLTLTFLVMKKCQSLWRNYTIFESKVFLKTLLMFIFTGNRNTAKKFFIRNGYMFIIRMSFLVKIMTFFP